MRSTTVIAVGVIVIIVLGLIMFTVRNRDTAGPDSENEDIPATAAPLPSSGQFFQAVPSDVVLEESPTPSPAPAAETVTITMSEVGFSPAAITVPIGTKVTFVNDGQAAHWPASDVHPTHEILPAFDAKRGLSTGETYSYTFTAVGTWPCHDHLMPQHTCSITVGE
jgi:plastocyanin